MIRWARALHLPAVGRGGACGGDDDAARRWHEPEGGDWCATMCTPGAFYMATMLRGDRWAADELWVYVQGER